MAPVRSWRTSTSTSVVTSGSTREKILLSHDRRRGRHYLSQNAFTSDRYKPQSAFAARCCAQPTYAMMPKGEEEEEEEERGLQTGPPLASRRDRHRRWPIAPEPDPLPSRPPSPPCALPTPAVSSPALPEPIRDWV